MLESVFKYALAVTDTQELELPVGAVPLHAGLQNGILHVWCRVNLHNVWDEKWNEKRSMWWEQVTSVTTLVHIFQHL